MSVQFLVSGLFAFICVATLHGAPDPDLFDGRYTEASSGSSATGDGTDGDGEDSAGGEAGEGGEGTSESSSEVASGNDSADNASADGQTSGSGKSGSGSSSVEATTSATGSTRSFDEFEIGVVDETNGQLETKRSKELGETPSSTSRSSSQTVNSSVQNPDKTAPKSDPINQAPFDQSGSADYGTNVPSGL